MADIDPVETDPTAPAPASDAPAEKTDTLTRLRKVAAALDSSLLVGSNEVQPLLSALLYEAEFGDKLFEAAEDDENPTAAVSNLIAPPVTETDAGRTPASGSASQDDLNELRAQLQHAQSQLATLQQTQVEHETGAGTTETDAQE